MKMFLNDLPLARKFAVAGAIAACMVGLPTWLVLKEDLGALRKARAELAGIAPASKALALVRLTQQHRGMSLLQLTGHQDMVAPRGAVSDRLDAETRSLLDAVGAMGDEKLRTSAAEVARAWKDLRDAVVAGQVTGAVSSARHTALVASELALLEDITHEAGIVLNPRRSVHFLQGGVLLYLPQLTESLGQLRARGALLLGQGSATAGDREKLKGMADLAAQQFARAQKHLALAVEDDRLLRGRMAEPIAKASAASTRAFELLDRRIIAAEPFDLAPAVYFAEMTAVIDEQFELVDLTFAQLDQALTEQAAAARRQVVLVLGLVVGLAALGAWVMVRISRSTTASVATALNAARAVERGDLAERVPTGGRDEVGQLLEALEGMRARLGQVVRTVRGNAESVSTASTQIAQGNLDLSQRTEGQASALQETAASMEQLSATVRLNSEHAVEADRLAAEASNVATEGGRLFGDVVSTMQRIEASSRRISDILEVIDGIAFQTNILALNAAVEAARAGEQGRGFAVVAAEVRSLAHRSSESARQIKSLIGASRADVERGAALVQQAGGTIDGIVASIRRVSTVVGGISVASREQSSGVAQVGVAVAQLDHATQQNAALVEQSAAAAESLEAQARQLVQAVSLFKLAA